MGCPMPVLPGTANESKKEKGRRKNRHPILLPKNQALNLSDQTE